MEVGNPLNTLLKDACNHFVDNCLISFFLLEILQQNLMDRGKIKTM
jgi:hypothetical protein